MTRIELLVTKFLVIGSGIALVTISASQPVSAQVPCPPGYYFSYGYGCVPAAPGYDYMYGLGYGYAPPVYDSFGMAFGFGGGGGRGGRGGGGHGGGGGRGGGGHGGGGHGGGRR
jgi:hypothetical protein